MCTFPAYTSIFCINKVIQFFWIGFMRNIRRMEIYQNLSNFRYRIKCVWCNNIYFHKMWQMFYLEKWINNNIGLFNEGPIWSYKWLVSSLLNQFSHIGGCKLNIQKFVIHFDHNTKIFIVHNVIILLFKLLTIKFYFSFGQFYYKSIGGSCVPDLYNQKNITVFNCSTIK